MWVWLVLAFIAGFAIASGIWAFRFRDKAPVGCLMEEYTEGDLPVYWMKYNDDSIERISKSRYVRMGVVHVNNVKKARKKGER